MKLTPWFYDKSLIARTGNEGLAKAHRTAYEKSLKDSRHAVKATTGSYYYRGYYIGKDGGGECPWCYNKPDASDFDKEWAETKKHAMEYIDYILNNKIDLCDIMFG